MSFIEKFKKAALMSALGATLVAPEAKAKDTMPTEKAPTPVTQSVKSEWTWGTDAASMRDKAIFESLPPEYKAFAGKNFMERLEMKEEWEQKDFLKRDRKRSAILRRNPDATIGDFAPQAALPGLKLADYPVAPPTYEGKIIAEQALGKLSPAQAKVAEEMMKLGRPLATIPSDLSYSEQLKLCGFDMAAEVAGGKALTSLNARDRSIFIAEDQEADLLNNRNGEARRELRIRFAQEDAAEWDKNNTFFNRLFRTKTRLLTEEEMEGKFPRETINGKDVAIRQPNEITYSIRDEVTRRVADKIDREEKATAQRAKDAALSH